MRGGLAPAAALAAALLALSGLAGCAKPRPVLYPDDRELAGTEAAERDIAECIALADAADLEEGRAGETAKRTTGGAGVGAAVGAAVGAVFGNPGRGAAAGAAGGGTRGFLRGIFGGRDPGPLYRRYVEICLQERGYRTLGWK